MNFSGLGLVKLIHKIINISILLTLLFVVSLEGVFNMHYSSGTRKKQETAENIVNEILTFADRSDIGVIITITDSQFFYAMTKPIFPRYFLGDSVGMFLNFHNSSYKYEIEISSGILCICSDEDMLAGLLAHEVAHIVLNHCDKLVSSLISDQSLSSDERKEMELEADRYALFFCCIFRV